MQRLEKKGAIFILTFLLDKDRGVPISKLVNEIGAAGQTAIYNAVKSLMEIGLLAQELTEHFPKSRLIRLTNKGRKVAEKLIEIEAVLFT